MNARAAGTSGPNPALGEMAFPGAAPLGGCERELGAKVRQRSWGRWTGGGTLFRTRCSRRHPLRQTPIPCALPGPEKQPRGRGGLRVFLGSCPRPAAVTQPSGSRVRGGVGDRSIRPPGPGPSAFSARAAAPPAGHLAQAGRQRPLPDPQPRPLRAEQRAERSRPSPKSSPTRLAAARDAQLPPMEATLDAPHRGRSAPATPAPGTTPAHSGARLYKP